ncbi:MAG: hypothetical protein ISS92_02635 [Candidatus Omnitrophica bacterium]|nr:hypothetical protein [Candidatus Omnitrophota bacterium]
MKQKNSILLTLTVASLVTGSLIGAGILALPIKTGLSGFIPSLCGMAVICAAMLFTATILAREATESKDPNFHYATMYKKYLGPFGKWIAIFANLIVLYGLLTAYLTGAATVISKFFNFEVTSDWVLLAFFLLMTSLLLAGISIIRKYNAVLMVILWGAFALIAYLTAGYVETKNLLYTDWSYLPASIPLIVTAFYFHNIIPSCCKAVNWDYRTIRITLLVGILIGFIMYAVWVYLAVGALPLEGEQYSLMYAFNHNYPATIPLSQRINLPLFTYGSLIFALFAITTSYIACGLGLMAFIKDLAVNHFHVKNKYFVIVSSFIPPLVISLIYPNVFLKALDIVGGVGIVILFGILPCIIALMKAKRMISRIFCVLILLLFSGLFGLEIMKEFGILKVKPHVRYWDSMKSLFDHDLHK